MSKRCTVFMSITSAAPAAVAAVAPTAAGRSGCQGGGREFVLSVGLEGDDALAGWVEGLLQVR
jgi:hypothetical protein